MCLKENYSKECSRQCVITVGRCDRILDVNAVLVVSSPSHPPLPTYLLQVTAYHVSH